MRAKHKTGLLLALVMMCILCFSVVPVWAEPQGTDGTELQVAQPEQLEIQLGAEWAGVEFQMKTDAGLYPGTIPVGQDGVLCLEIGGSKSYVLTCLNSAAKAPSPTQAPARAESQPEEKTEGSSAEEKDATVAGIPVLHLCLFVGGMVLAVGGLITMHVVKRRREDEDGYEYEEDEDE